MQQSYKILSKITKNDNILKFYLTPEFLKCVI